MIYVYIYILYIWCICSYYKYVQFVRILRTHVFYVLWSLYVSQSCHFISSSWPAFVVSKTWGLQQECQADYPSLRLLQKVGCFTCGNLPVAFMIVACFSEIAVLLPHNLATCLPYTNDSTSHESLYRKRDRNMGIAVFDSLQHEPICGSSFLVQLHTVLVIANCHILYINVTSPYRITYPICLMYGIFICIWLKFVW